MRQCSITFLLLVILCMVIFITFQAAEIEVLKDANIKLMNAVITYSTDMQVLQNYYYDKFHKAM